MRSSNHHETYPVLSTSSRRRFVGGLTTGLVVAVAGQAVGREPVPFGISTLPHLSQSQDPFSQCHPPPVPTQLQEWPCLAGKMESRPDHGEVFYQGTSRLSGGKALITGEDSGIGHAAGTAFGREGADEINSLATEEHEGKAVAIPGAIRGKDFCQKVELGDGLFAASLVAAAKPNRFRI